MNDNERNAIAMLKECRLWLYLTQQHLDAIDTLIASVEANDWVPVAERLPETHEGCWFDTTTKDGFVRPLYHNGHGRWFDNPASQLMGNSIEIVAWKHRVQPYGGSND